MRPALWNAALWNTALWSACLAAMAGASAAPNAKPVPEPEDIQPRPPEPVSDRVLSCPQIEPFEVTHRFAIEGGAARLYNHFARRTQDFCLPDDPLCVTGWHEGDPVYLRDFRIGARQITRLDLEAMTMRVVTLQDPYEPVETEFACSSEPLPTAR